jgi:hypothetical protein
VGSSQRRTIGTIEGKMRQICTTPNRHDLHLLQTPNPRTREDSQFPSRKDLPTIPLPKAQVAGNLGEEPDQEGLEMPLDLQAIFPQQDLFLPNAMLLEDLEYVAVTWAEELEAKRNSPAVRKEVAPLEGDSREEGKESLETTAARSKSEGGGEGGQTQFSIRMDLLSEAMETIRKGGMLNPAGASDQETEGTLGPRGPVALMAPAWVPESGNKRARTPVRDSDMAGREKEGQEANQTTSTTDQSPARSPGPPVLLPCKGSSSLLGKRSQGVGCKDLCSVGPPTTQGGLDSESSRGDTSPSGPTGSILSSETPRSLLDESSSGEDSDGRRLRDAYQLVRKDPRIHFGRCPPAMELRVVPWQKKVFPLSRGEVEEFGVVQLWDS